MLISSMLPGISLKRVSKGITGATGEMNFSVFLRFFFQYLVNLSDSFFKNIPRLKVYKMVCFLLTK